MWDHEAKLVIYEYDKGENRQIEKRRFNCIAMV